MLRILQRLQRRQRVIKLRFDPVVKNGRFAVTYAGKTRTYSAIDAAGAKWKYCQFLGLVHPVDGMTCEVVSPTIRQNMV